MIKLRWNNIVFEREEMDGRWPYNVRSTADTVVCSRDGFVDPGHGKSVDAEAKRLPDMVVCSRDGFVDPGHGKPVDAKAKRLPDTNPCSASQRFQRGR